MKSFLVVCFLILGSLAKSASIIDSGTLFCAPQGGKYVTILRDSIDARDRSECVIYVEYLSDAKIARADFAFEAFYTDVVGDKLLSLQKDLGGEYVFASEHASSEDASFEQATAAETEMDTSIAYLGFPVDLSWESPLDFTEVGVTVFLAFTDGTRKTVYATIPVTTP